MRVAGKDQEMLLIVKEEDGSITKSQLGVFSFVPMLKETAK
jgi:protein-L-isoaspartate(D-aspartate) O-methyltransferase